jgi:hypothetical protein
MQKLQEVLLLYYMFSLLFLLLTFLRVCAIAGFEPYSTLLERQAKQLKLARGLYGCMPKQSQGMCSTTTEKSKHHALNEIRTRDSIIRETQYCELLEPGLIEIACCLRYS